MAVSSRHFKSPLATFLQVGDTIDANLGIVIIGVCKMAGNIFSALIIDKVSPDSGASKKLGCLEDKQKML
jgi:hypothetical protein